MHYTNYQGAQERASSSRATDVQPGRSLYEPQSSSQDTSDRAGFWDSPQALDVHLRDQLHNYSFGTAPRLSNSPSSNPAATQDEADLEDLMARIDITPRPSVVAYSYQHIPRISTQRDQGSRRFMGDFPHETQTTPNDARERANGSAPSSASVSVTSFNDSLYSGSVVTRDSSLVPHTSINEFTSSEEDEDRSRRSDFSISGPYGSSANASATSMEFSSEEEYDSDDTPDLEISSTSIYSEQNYTQERRGSVPMVIPGSAITPSITGQYHSGRDRTDLITVRRPSRSLDDDLSMLEVMRNHSSKTRPDDDLLPSPVSMPGSEGDWRNLNERAMRRGSVIETGGSFYYSSDASSQKQASSSKAIDVGDFDPGWANLRHGIVSMDQADLEDIVGRPARPTASSRWFSRFGSSSNQSNKYTRRPSVATISSDTFGKAITGWGGEGYRSQRHQWSFKREKTTTTAQHTPVTSGSTVGRGFSGFLNTKPSEDQKKRTQKEREKEKDRLARVTASWRGMPIDSQEIWKMDIIGRFKVERKATKTADIAKGPQQRIIVHRLREIDNNQFYTFFGPTSTVHKHSKAVAFSIGRYYRRRTDSKEKSREANNGGPLINASHPPALPFESQKRQGSMVLLAPRRVQIAFTNTTSTRKLESHGLLDEDQPRRATREHDPAKRDRERDKKDHKGKAREKQTLERMQDMNLGEGSERRSFASSSAVNLSESSRATNASGSASVMTSTTTMVSTSSIPSTPASLNADLNESSSHVSTLAAASSKSVTEFSADLSMNRPRRRRRRVHDPLELDEDEEYGEDGRNSSPTRTPYSETYGTVDASLIEQLNLERAQLELETGSVFWKFFRNRNSKPNASPAPGHFEANYVPPWILLPSRSRQEQQARVVENLNSSFMDVGLLPSTHRTRKQGQSKKKHDDQSNGILSEVPEESLYMLLPLWPGETDPVSAQEHPHLIRRIPPTKFRQYLLIYYRAVEKRDKKKRAPPISDYERGDRTILLSSFHISARFVDHNELIGTGIRVPEEGLTISGPLNYAWDTLPAAETREVCQSDQVVVGVCHSRESGIEFVPEGLVKMGLCHMSWTPPNAVNDKYIPPEPIFKLTPIGQAVVEMAWLGAIALTSFGQVGLV